MDSASDRDLVVSHAGKRATFTELIADGQRLQLRSGLSVCDQVFVKVCWFSASVFCLDEGTAERGKSDASDRSGG